MSPDAVHHDPPRVLAPYVRVGVQDETLFLGFGSIRQPVHDRALWEPLLLLADHFRKPRTREAASVHLHSRGVDAASTEAAMLLLEHGNCLIPAHSYDRADRYSRHTLFYELSGADAERVQRRLGEASVVLLGCGGIGSLVAVTLATAGVGELVLMDGDHVELSNLTRQFLFTETDIGLPKAEVLARELRRRNSSCRVRPVVHGVADTTDLEHLPACDLLVVSADSPGLTGLVNAHCVTSGTAWLNACYVNDIAVWGPLVVPGTTGCWNCRPLTARPPEDEAELASLIARVNGRYQAPSNGPVNMLASSLAALDVLRHLGGFGTPASLNRRVGVWSHDLTLDQQAAERDPTCPTCAEAVLSREGVR
ncbi:MULTISPECIES: TOMM precursor leader peptide-binding protein [unclassified Nocardiopsis]|uniref:TOMM precursor leader peptide-binding protein n=1 Tax=unclassified Nocardiopsis TaxID=2649073 RepID=UPI0013598350|nr:MULTISPECIES: TOMM precursor leader peptide-binding protein [unclassified Nocardiopsis]